MQQLGSDEIMTVSEVAKNLRCSRAHVDHAINGTLAGVSPLPAILMGRRRLIRRSTLEQWKRENEQTASGATIDPSLKIHAVDA
jgi:excisionase family DNA binding protein